MQDHVAENRRYWNEYAPQWVAAGEREWAARSPYWGMWRIPQSEVPLLPDEMGQVNAIELGCGTGYISAWMQRRGAAVTAIDNSENQLATARRLAAEHGIEDIEWIHGNAEDVPKPDGSYGFAISEYGASIWCDPTVWIPEAHRLLVPGGRLVMLGNSPIASICTPLGGENVDLRLHRSYFDLGRMDWTEVEIDPGGVEFNLSISGWFKLFHDTGFTVDNYLELRAPADNTDTLFAISGEWARQYPSEHVWMLHKE
ncbi:MAG: class I SAM-dependent methyltransferase [Actinomycetia bacterium]|nr:class I SAM-dependent methyltransferase [Actinomycetes bacterium]MCP4961145.1 class I SAM-dependent methyltransferase [Actinomycetes bacterium]